jgi:hypothetical protein
MIGRTRRNKGEAEEAIETTESGDPGRYDRGMARAVEPEDLEDFEAEYRPLVDRLRHMDWPEVPSDVRDRCWHEFQEMMRKSGAGPTSGRKGDPSSGEA